MNTTSSAQANAQNGMISIMDNAEMRPIHYKIWLLSSGGTILDGFTIFTIGIVLPILASVFSIGASQTGLIAAAIVLGSVLGAISGGILADRFGRKVIYIADMAMICVSALVTSIAPGPGILLAFQFFVGVGIGMDFPVGASYVSEFMPAKRRSRMLAGTIAFQAVGMILASVIGILLLRIIDSDGAWRYMLGFTVILSFVIMLFRLTVPESARWYMNKGLNVKAGEVIARLVPGQSDEIRKLAKEAGDFSGEEAKNPQEEDSGESKAGYAVLFSAPYRRRTILTAGSWFFMDIATYGIGLFTPIILAGLAFSGRSGDLIDKDILSARGSGIIDLFLLAGFILGIWLIPKFGAMKMQITGFAGMAAGMVLLSFSGSLPDGSAGSIALIYAGFIIFNVLMNMGPNSTTFMLPAELYPTKLRATGGGFAASFAKVGASIGIFFLPGIKDSLGVTAVLLMMAACSLIGLAITFFFGIETKGKTLESFDGK